MMLLRTCIAATILVGCFAHELAPGDLILKGTGNGSSVNSLGYNYPPNCIIATMFEVNSDTIPNDGERYWFVARQNERTKVLNDYLGQWQSLEEWETIHNSLRLQKPWMEARGSAHQLLRGDLIITRCDNMHKMYEVGDLPIPNNGKWSWLVARNNDRTPAIDAFKGQEKSLKDWGSARKGLGLQPWTGAYWSYAPPASAHGATEPTPVAPKVLQTKDDVPESSILEEAGVDEKAPTAPVETPQQSVAPAPVHGGGTAPTPDQAVSVAPQVPQTSVQEAIAQTNQKPIGTIRRSVPPAPVHDTSGLTPEPVVYRLFPGDLIIKCCDYKGIMHKMYEVGPSTVTNDGKFSYLVARKKDRHAAIDCFLGEEKSREEWREICDYLYPKRWVGAYWTSAPNAAPRPTSAQAVLDDEKAPPSSTWKRRHDPNTGHVYWFQEETKRVTFKPVNPDDGTSLEVGYDSKIQHEQWVELALSDDANAFPKWCLMREQQGCWILKKRMSDELWTRVGPSECYGCGYCLWTPWSLLTPAWEMKHDHNTNRVYWYDTSNSQVRLTPPPGTDHLRYILRYDGRPEWSIIKRNSCFYLQTRPHIYAPWEDVKRKLRVIPNQGVNEPKAIRNLPPKKQKRDQLPVAAFPK